MSRPCDACGGRGGFERVERECCGDYLPSGECCAAVYGTDRLVPARYVDPCERCGGSAETPDPGDEDFGKEAQG